MAIKRSKRNLEEKLTPTNIDYVIGLLEAEKPITKKDACSILNIAYNTTRLTQIIQRHKEAKDRASRRRAEKRGKPLTQDEVVYIIQEYLNGDTIDSISNTVYRGSTLIRQTLDKYSVPVRARTTDYFKPELIPEGAMRERFKVGEVVYSARYDTTAKIESERQQGDKWVYGVWLIGEKWQQRAYQPAEELASLEHLRELGVRV
jgi:hypothetical protein